jgi:pimeloyl-ACP methyl ester carboxylesterase
VLVSLRKKKKPFSTVANTQEAASKLREQNAALSEAGALRMVRNVMRAQADGRLAFPYDERLRGPTPQRFPESTWLACARRMKMPVLVLRAEHGYVPEGEPVQSRVDAMARAHVKTLAGMHHHIHVDAPEAVAAAVVTLLGAPI